MMALLPILKNKYLPFLFAVPLFLCAYRYNGIVMDAILYVTQYVYSIDPLRFSADPAFEYGNQDSLGLFSPFFGLFLEFFGISAGAFVYTLLMQFLWIVSFVFLVKKLMKVTCQRLWTLPVVVLLVCFFSNGMPLSHISWFHYLPSYACSRSFSVVLGMMGIALLFNKKKFFSLLLILTGTIIHPLSAGWCFPFWIFWFFPKMRIPVVIFSLLFPLTYLLHLGPFDVYPTDWLSRPLSFRPGYEVFSKYILFFVFFGMMVRNKVNKNIQNIGISMSLLMMISLYWDIWGGGGEHIFLYQAQPWRALWFPSIVAAPLGTCFLKDAIQNYARNRFISTHDVGWALLFVSFLAPENLILVSVGCVILLLVRKTKISIKALVSLFAGFMIGGYLVQQYITWCLQGFPDFFNWTIMELYRIKDSFFIFQLFFAIGFVVYFLKQRLYLLAALLLSSIFFAKFMLLPILPFFLYFFPKEKKGLFGGGICIIVLLILFDGLVDVEARNQTLAHGLPVSFFKVCFVVVISFFSVFSSKWFGYKSIFVCLLICYVTAVVSYCEHSVNWREKEKQLDQYLHESIFPMVEERGRVLFYVSGAYVENPRLQFMTGSYFDGSVDVGSLFHKGHYRTALERSHFLFWKNQEPESKKFFEYSEIIKKIADVDTLIDRVSFLCGANEIHHLVTDKESLPFIKEDSAIVNDGQKVFLYGCSLDKKRCLK